MGTKNNPGTFDCYANAEPDEPMFILLARDRMAPELVDLWADEREYNGEDAAKVAEARQCAENMRAWRKENRPDSTYSLDMHCKSCAKDFNVDSSELKGVKPTCPHCGFEDTEIVDVDEPTK